MLLKKLISLFRNEKKIFYKQISLIRFFKKINKKKKNLLK